MRADWDPDYALKVVPLVFLARLNVIAVIPFAAFFGVLSIGGEYAARKADVPNVFLLLVVGLILLFMVVTQFLSDRRSRGEPILPARWRRSSHARRLPVPDLLTPTFLTALIGAGLLSAVPLLFAGPGRDHRGAGRHPQCRARGDDARGRVRRASSRPCPPATCGWASWRAVSPACCSRSSWSCSASGWVSTRSSWASASCSRAEGATSLLHTTWFGQTYPRLDAVPDVRYPAAAGHPGPGRQRVHASRCRCTSVWHSSAVIGWVLRRTSAGLEVRAAGERPDSLDAAGVSVVRVRTLAELTCGFLAGVGGAYLVHRQRRHVRAVRSPTALGFIAIVIAMLGRGRPWWVVCGGVAVRHVTVRDHGTPAHRRRHPGRRGADAAVHLGHRRAGAVRAGRASARRRSGCPTCEAVADAPDR